MDRVCETCRFWKKNDDRINATAGQCHRYPPPCFWDVSEHEAYSLLLFPGTPKDEWCGEWQPADADQK